MSSLPQSLTLAQIVKLERLPESSKVIGWCHVPPGPVVRRSDGLLKVIKPDGRLCKARAFA